MYAIFLIWDQSDDFLRPYLLTPSEDELYDELDDLDARGVRYFWRSI